MTSFPMDSLSPALSEITVQTDSELTSNGLYPDLLLANGSGNYQPDYCNFPDFDDFGVDFYMPGLLSLDYGEENTDGIIIEDSFLWNF